MSPDPTSSEVTPAAADPTPGTASKPAKPAKAGKAKPGPSEETKARFREALARKQSHAGREGGGDGEGKLHESHGHGPATAQRMFRRKAGG